MKLSDYKIIDGQLYIVDFPAPFSAEIKKLVYVEDIGVAVEINGMKKDDPETPHRNIFLLNPKGEAIWQIEEFTLVKGRSSYYTNVWIGEQGELRVFNPLGFDCRVDIKTGKLLDCVFTK